MSSDTELDEILNLYAGIGGNRKLWGDEHEITAIELVPELGLHVFNAAQKETVQEALL